MSLAYLWGTDYRRKLDRGEAEKVELDPRIEAIGGLPDEAHAVLASYMREPPGPAYFVSHPHQTIAGLRIYSRWFAAQLLDGAFVRGIAICDRLVVLLWTRAGIALPQGRDGQTRLPGFTAGRLRQLAAHYAPRDEWKAFAALVDNEIFVVVKRFRDGFVHRRRAYSELHGERVVSAWGIEPTAGMEAREHFALALAFYELVVKPGVAAAGGLVSVSEGSTS